MSQSRQMLASLICALLCVGLLMVYSSSMTARPSQAEEFYLTKQALFLLFGLGLGGAATVLPARFWKSSAPWLFGCGLLLLLLVLIPGIGTQVKGSRRWLRLAGVSLQPSEFMKVATTLLLAWGMERYWHRRHDFVRGTVVLLVPVALAVGLVMIEPDLGASVFLSMTVLLALFIRGWPLGRLVAIGAVIAPLASVWLVLKPYQLRRLQGFLATWTDFEQAPYQVQQSLTTLGVGGWLGTGLGEGTQKLSFLPEANTDFVFSVVGEELGLVGTLGISLLWLSLLWVGVRVLRPLPRDSFEYTVGFVLLCQMVAQAATNVAVTTAMLPPKGIAHPLISYGGSSLCTSLLSMGILLSVSRVAAIQRPEGLSIPLPSQRNAA
jgi:cell division protein FtsW